MIDNIETEAVKELTSLIKYNEAINDLKYRYLYYQASSINIAKFEKELSTINEIAMANQVIETPHLTKASQFFI